MSFRSRNNRRLGVVVALATLTLGLGGTVARAQDQPSPLAATQEPVALTTLFPGGGSMPAENPVAKKYDGNAKAIAAGARLFDWYNCSGCHFHGAGGIGPALMDDIWIYGGRIDQVYDSIARGRPNGMPSWQGKIPPEQIWQIAAYVRSLSAKAATKGGSGESMPVPAPPPLASPPSQAKPATAPGPKQ
jgi:cytochrome c oxidase cbb3-type subunit 3